MCSASHIWFLWLCFMTHQWCMPLCGENSTCVGLDIYKVININDIQNAGN